MKRERNFLPQLAGLFFCFCLFFFPLGAHSKEDENPVPLVLVTIKPLHSLVAGVMKGIGNPGLLIRGSSSPHHFSLRPSDMKAVGSADLIVWIGPAFETFLEKPLHDRHRKASLLTLGEVLKEKLLPADPDHHCDEHDHHHHHDDLFLDYHFWLDPGLAKETVFLVAEKLGEMDGSRKNLYLSNAGKMAEKLDALDEGIRKKLLPVKEVPYLVFHPAYQYFEKTYDLNPVGVIALDPERQPGARKVLEIKKQIRDLKVRCVFSEPQFESRLVSALTEGLDVKKGILDPLGAGISENSEMYFILLDNLADNLLKGLEE